MISFSAMLEDVIMTNQTKNGEVLYANTSDFPAIIIVTCMLTIFSIVGTTGNAFVLYVFSKKKDKTTSTVFILALALIDFVTCLFLIPFTIVVEFLYKKIDNDALCKIYQFFVTSNVPLSAFIMTAIAFDRYLCICRPWVKFLDIRFAKKIIIALLVISLVFGLITSLAYGVYHQTHTVSTRLTVTDNVTHSPTSNYESRINIVQTSTLPSECFKNFTNTLTPSEIHIYKVCMQSHVKKNESSNAENHFYFTGYCYPNEKIFSRQFRKAYQTLYASLFLLVFLLVFVLYALILRSILARRSKRLRSSIAYRSYQGRNQTTMYYHSGQCRRKSPEPSIPVSHKSNLAADKLATGNAVLLEDCTENKNKINTIASVNTNKNGFANGKCDTIKSVQISNNEHIKTKHETTSLTMVSSKVDTVTKETNTLDPAVNHQTNGRRRMHKKKRFSDQKQTNSLNGAGGDHNSQLEIFRIMPNNICRHDTRKSIRERLRLANIKTAGILFTVTLVFIIAFLPAWLMATRLISPPNMIVFYMYFIYNVANPFIYAFFNQTFQKEMKTVLKCNNI